jgi:hypothetical protein
MNIAWAAGLFEGEGCIARWRKVSVLANGKRQTRYYPRATVGEFLNDVTKEIT